MPRRDDAIDPDRLARAIPLKWDQIGPRQFMIQGRDEPYYIVDLDAEVPCLCKDARHHGLTCKHRLKALIVERHPAVFDQVLALYERQAAQQREETEARARHGARSSARGVRTEATSARPAGTERARRPATRTRRATVAV